MATALVVHYSSWSHMVQMAKAAAKGARDAGDEVTVTAQELERAKFQGKRRRDHREAARLIG